MSVDARWFFTSIKSVTADGAVTLASKPFENAVIQLPYFYGAQPGDVFAVLVTVPDAKNGNEGQCIGARFLNRPGLAAPHGVYVIQTPHGFLAGAAISDQRIKPLFGDQPQHAMPFGDAGMAGSICALLAGANIEAAILPIFAQTKPLIHLPRGRM